MKIEEITKATGVSTYSLYKAINKDRTKPETVAFQWWKSIKKEIYNPKLVKVVINDGDDITENVRRLENAPIPQDYLPF
jgi:hypothetical protein